MKQSIDVTIGMKADTSGADAVRHTLGSLSQEAEKVNATVKGASLEMGTAMEAARGSVNGIIKLIVSLGKRMGILKDMSLAAIGAIAGAVTSMIHLGGALKDLFSYTFNLGQAPADIRACSNAVYDMQTAAADFADSMKTARTDAAELTKTFNAQVDATTKLVKAQNELHRAQMLARAGSDDERTRINNVYNALNANADDDAAAQKLAQREKDLNDEEARLRAEIAQAEKDKADAERIAREAGARGSELRTNWFSGMVQGWFGRNPNESAQAAFNTAAGARNLAFEKDEEIDAAKKKLEALKAVREQLDTERKAISTATATHEQQAKNADAGLAKKAAKEAADAKKKEEERIAKTIAAEEERLAKEREWVQNKIARDLLNEQIEGARAAHDARMKQLDEEKRKAEEAARVWEDAAARARESAQGGGGFGKWNASERDREREEARAKAKRDNALAQAEKEIERLDEKQSRGKAFFTEADLKRKIGLEQYAAYLSGNNPSNAEIERIEKEKNTLITNLKTTVDTIQTQLSSLGL